MMRVVLLHCFYSQVTGKLLSCTFTPFLFWKMCCLRKSILTVSCQHSVLYFLYFLDAGFSTD